MSHAILLVEDDEDLREGLAALLENDGYEVVTARNGREALDTLRSLDTPPCIVLLDLMMPIMDGWSMRAEMLRDPRHAHIPVVLLSGVADLQSDVAALQAVGYLTKPVDLDRLYRVVGTHCPISDAMQ